MQFILAGICFFGSIATMIFVKSLNLGAGLTIAVIIPLIFLVIYSLARIKPQKPGAEKDPRK
jgi:hypothetical protein